MTDRKAQSTEGETKMTDAFGRKIWVPAEEPFRVTEVGSRRYGMHNQRRLDRVIGTFPTLDAAMAAAAAVSSGVVTVDRAINPETWRENGKWLRVASRTWS